jgi:hypothetical protein
VFHPFVGLDGFTEAGEYRVSLYIERGNVKIMTRNGNDWAKRFPLVATAAAALNVDSAIIDGEVVMPDDMGRSHFFDLHAAASGKVCAGCDLLRLRFALAQWRGFAG